MMHILLSNHMSFSQFLLQGSRGYAIPLYVFRIVYWEIVTNDSNVKRKHQTFKRYLWLCKYANAPNVINL